MGTQNVVRLLAWHNWYNNLNVFIFIYSLAKVHK